MTKSIGSGNVECVKTEGRMKAIGRIFCEYFELDGIDICGDGSICTKEELLLEGEGFSEMSSKDRESKTENVESEMFKKEDAEVDSFRRS